MKTIALRSLLGALLAVYLLAVRTDAAAAQSVRTWVSGVGNDANLCTRTQPCLTFQGAHDKTAAGGEIGCLDPVSSSPVTIAKSITIDCTGTLGSILSIGSSIGVYVQTPGVNVILRGITINGQITGYAGVYFTAGSSLTLENVVIMNHNYAGAAYGILFSPSSANAVLTVNNSLILSNGLAPAQGGGIVVAPATGGNNALVSIVNSRIERNGGAGVGAFVSFGSLIMTVRDSTISNNTFGGVYSSAITSIALMLDRVTINSNSQSGVLSSGNSRVRVNNSVIHANAIGLSSTSGGVLLTAGNNTVEGNGTDGTFTGSYVQK